MMKESARRLFVRIEKNPPENIVLCNEKSVAKVAVTVDGTWQKRGFSFKIGVVFLSVDTGKVLDAMVKSSECHECVGSINHQLTMKHGTKGTNKIATSIIWALQGGESCCNWNFPEKYRDT